MTFTSFLKFLQVNFEAKIKFEEDFQVKILESNQRPKEVCDGECKAEYPNNSAAFKECSAAMHTSWHYELTSRICSSQNTETETKI